MATTAEKRAAFVIEYIKDLNGTQAAIRAGYSHRGASVTASRLLANAKIQEQIQKAFDKRMENCEIDADYVLRRLVEIDQMDIRDIFDDNLEQLLPLDQWPQVWRQTVNGIDVTVLSDHIDGEKVDIGLLKKIKWPDKVKNLELIGKHTKVKAWDKDVNLKGDGIEMHLHYG